jgi:lipoprotein NlpI
MTGTGPFAVMLRGIGLAIQSVGPDRAVTAMLQRAGIPGSGSFIVPSPDNLDSNFVVTASFALGPFSDVLEGRPFSVPTGLTLLGSPGNSLMGPLTERKISDTEPTTCYSGTQEEDISVEAPKGRRFIALPHDTSVATSNIKFLIHWTGDGQTIKVHREFSSNVATALCSGDVRKDTAKALTEIMNGYSDGLTLSKELSAADQKLADMLSDGAEAIKKSDYEDAVRIFTNALAWNELPAKAAPYMHLGRAQAYVGEAKFDLAIADCEEAVKLDSSLASGYPTLARALAGQREFRRSEQVWTTAITLNPKSAYLYDSRGILRDDLGDHAGAVADFNQAIALAQPTDKIARYYFDLGVSYWLVHDWATAIADDSEAIRHDANFVAAYLGRARSEYFAGKLDAAIADLTTALQLDSRDMYGSLWLYIAEARAGKDAKGDLARRTQGVDLSEWPGPLIRVLRGDLKPNEVTLPVHNAAWQTKRDQCEEDFYEAEMFLLSGDKTSAVTLFRAAVDTGVVEYYEYLAATVELERLTH